MMQSNTTFFTGTLDPHTGEIHSVRVETHIPLPVGDLLVDVHYSPDVRRAEPPNTDPTLAQFYEPKQEGEHHETA